MVGRAQCRACGSTSIVQDNDTVACAACGCVLEQSQIVSEVTFGETSSGAATVQGSYVGADQAGARISGPGGFRGSSAGESRQQTLSNALQSIRRMANLWNLSENVILMAHRIFTLAMVGGGEWLREHADPSNFVLGRKSDITIASCLYLACRYENRPLMLIDFADSIGENVFTLGRSYLKLTRMIHMKPPRGSEGGGSTIVDPSIYIQRFAIMLDFGDEAPKVTADALRLIKRFSADWMVEGRRPAGICAAALILAARMNHFRRSIAEVVQVARIADVTLRKRLDEFAKTESSKLSVADFRTMWLENAQDPPAFYEPVEAERRKKRKVESLLAKGPLDADEGEGGEGNDAGVRKRRVTKKGKAKVANGAAAASGDADADGDADDEDAEHDDDDEDDQRDRSRNGAAALDAPETPEQAQERLRRIETEAEFDRLAEADVAALLHGPELRQTAEELEAEEAARIARARALPSAAASSSQAISMADIDPRLRPAEAGSSQERSGQGQAGKEASKTGPAQGEGSESANDGVAATERAGSEEAGPRAGAQNGHGDDHDSIADSSSDEEQDPERIYAQRVRKRSTSAPIMPGDELIGLDEEELDLYINTDAEVKAKERVWIEFNRDYLERELDKQLKIELMEKSGMPVAKREPRVRKPRDSSTPMARTAAEATQKMMRQHKAFSRRLNYDVLNQLFDQKPASVAPQKAKGGRGQGSQSQRRDKRGPATENEDEEEDETDDDEDDEEDDDGGEGGHGRRALQLGATTIYESGEVDDLPIAGTRSTSSSRSSKNKNKHNKKGGARTHASSRSRRSSTATAGPSSGAETDGATTDGGETTDTAAEYRRMVRGNMQDDDGLGFVADEWE